MSSRRKGLRPAPKSDDQPLNKREREGYGPLGPKKPAKLGRAIVPVSVEPKRDRTVAPSPIVSTRVDKFASDETIVYAVTRGKQGWSVSEAKLPAHVVESYDFKPIAGPSVVDLAMARLCERIELRAYTSGR